MRFLAEIWFLLPPSRGSRDLLTSRLMTELPATSFTTEFSMNILNMEKNSCVDGDSNPVPSDYQSETVTTRLMMSNEKAAF